MRVFYEDLYSSREIKKIDETVFKNFTDKLPKLTNDESSKLDLDTNLDELQSQIFSTKNNKSPGPDGFTNEFLKYSGRN